jgi:acyl-lipid omega-6 desaturase (Delta-12 desaturase)
VTRGADAMLANPVAETCSPVSAKTPPVQAAPLTQRELARSLLPYATPNTRKGLLLFASDYIVFITLLATALLASHWAVRCVASLLAGFKMSGLYTLAHDAAHNSLTPHRSLNKVLGILAYTPILFNYRLWLHDHNATHHVQTNGPQNDAFRPMALEAYRSAPAWRRAWERFGRWGHPVSLALYYVCGRWAEAKPVPTREYPSQIRKEAWPLTLLIGLYLACVLGGLWHRNGGALPSFASDVFFVLLLPFGAFQTALSTVLYYQHTHPSIPWFVHTDSDRGAYSQPDLTVHIKVPRILGVLAHDPFSHAAHHVCPAIPCYRLHEAQLRLSELLGARSIDLSLSWRAMRDVARRCKLYDHPNRRWVDFQGRPT